MWIMAKTAYLFLIVMLCQNLCEGFDFTFYPGLSDSSSEVKGRQVCGVLRCIESLMDTSHDKTKRSRTLSKLTISKSWLDESTDTDELWQELATVSGLQPNLHSVSDGVMAVGQLNDKQASLTLELTKISDCLESHFSCVAFIVDDLGRTSVKKSILGRTVKVLNPANDASVPLFRTVRAANNQTSLSTELSQVLSAIELKIFLLESRVEESLRSMENRIEDKIADLKTVVTEGSCCSDSAGTCSQLTSKLNELGDKLENNTGKLDNFAAGVKQQNENTWAALDQLGLALGQCNGYPLDEFSDPLNTGKNEWRLAFRGTAFNNVPVYPAYMSGTGIPLDVEQGCRQFNDSLPCANHYRNNDALVNWVRVGKVLFAIYKDSQLVKYVIFNGKGSTFTTWFAADRIISSSWTDLTTQPHNYFSIAGAVHNGCSRQFFMNLDYNYNCSGFRGWFKSTDIKNCCPVEINTPAIPMFQYAPGTTYAVWETNAAKADAFGIFLKYE